MVSYLFKIGYSLDMHSDYCFLFFKNSDVAIYLDVVKLLIMEIPQCYRNLMLSLVIEYDMKCACVIIDLECCPHRFFHSFK